MYTLTFQTSVSTEIYLHMQILNNVLRAICWLRSAVWWAQRNTQLPPSINQPAEVGTKASRTIEELKQDLATVLVASNLRACFVHLCAHIHERQHNCVNEKIELAMGIDFEDQRL
jgi:hypothetical protein